MLTQTSLIARATLENLLAVVPPHRQCLAHKPVQLPTRLVPVQVKEARLRPLVRLRAHWVEGH